MTKRLLIVACAFMLGGCALPVPVQIASWAVDGLLFVTTDKTVADHGISLVAQRDCAMLRVVTEGTVCRDDIAVAAVTIQELPSPGMDDPAKAVSVADAGALTDAPAAFAAEALAATELASFETAAGETAAGDRDSSSESVPFPENVSSGKPATTETRWEAIIAAPSFLDDSVDSAIIEPKRQSLPEQTAEPGIQQTTEPEPELATNTPAGAEEFSIPANGDYPLNLGELIPELHPLVMADLTLRGRADGDILYGPAGDMDDTQGPMPAVPPLAGFSAPFRHARRRRPGAHSLGKCGRGPPRRPGRAIRQVRARGSGS